MEKFDVVIIGSGCGASPAAGNLAASGAKVCVLERGNWWGPLQGHRAFPHGLREFIGATRGVGVGLPFMKRYININRLSGLYEYYIVMNGYVIIIPSGVGGGSLVIGGFIDRPPADYWGHYPAEITAGEMEPYFQSVAGVVEPAIAPKATWYDESIRRACENIDHITSYPQLTSMWYGSGPDAEETRINAFGVRQNNCTYQSHCLTGCNRSAKNSMDITYLQQVLQGGGEIRELSEAKMIRKNHAGYMVDYTDIRDGSLKTVSTDRCIVAAGALNTMKLLFASRENRGEGLPEISSMLGKKWGFNGDRVGLKRARSNPQDHSYGTCLFRYHELASEKYPFDFHQFACRSSALTWLPWPLNKLSGSIIPYLSLSREAPIGTIEPAGGGSVVAIDYPVQDGHRRADMAQRRITFESDCLVREPGEKERRKKIKKIESIKARRGIGSVHPTGGAAMADSINNGVVDHRGEVFNYPGLYISDASILPAGTCCGPHFTIMAHSDRISKLIIESE